MENKRYISHHLPQFFKKLFAQLLSDYLSRPEIASSGFFSPSTSYKLSTPVIQNTETDPAIYRWADNPAHENRNNPPRLQQTALY